MMNQFEQIRIMKFLKYVAGFQGNIEEKLCSSLVPVVNKKPLSNLTSDKGFSVVSSSGDSMDFSVLNCIEIHSISHNSIHRTSQFPNGFLA